MKLKPYLSDGLAAMPNDARRILRWILVSWALILFSLLFLWIEPFQWVLLFIGIAFGLAPFVMSLFGLRTAFPDQRMWFVLEAFCSVPAPLLIAVYLVAFWT